MSTVSTGLLTCEASGSPTKVKLRVELPQVQGNSLDHFQAIIQCCGKDVEYMGGNYGTLFKEERLMFELKPGATQAQEESK